MSLEDDILIDNYLRGLLDEKQVEDFNQRLSSDIEFRNDFELELALWSSQNESDWSFVSHKNDDVSAYKKLLEEDDLQNLKKSLSRVNSDYAAKQSTKKSKFNFYYLVAASVVLLICLNLFIGQDLSNQDLVNNYLNTSDLPSFVSRGDSETEALVKAQELFENEDYQQALDLFIPAFENKNNASVYVYTGITQLKLKKYTAAETTFNELINSDLLDAQKGYWYKALLYIEQDKITDAKTILNSIISKSLYNNDKAKTLLNKLKDE